VTLIHVITLINWIVTLSFRNNWTTLTLISGRQNLTWCSFFIFSAVYWLPFRATLPTSRIIKQVYLNNPQDPEKFENLFLCMIIEYDSHSVFWLGKSNSASQYDTVLGEYDFIKVLLTTVCTNEIADIYRSYNKL
jgi:hypothetical protein